MKKRQENIDETILIRILDNTADEKEKSLFASWIEDTAENAETFEQLKRTYHLTSIDKNSLQKNWESVVLKVKSGNEVPDYIELPKPQTLTFNLKLYKLLRVAAILILFLGVSFLLKIAVFNPKQVIISSNDLSPHEPYHLADGSLVYLNENSEISFSSRFGKKDRNINLKGEAFFEVQRNEKIPFVITTYKTTTQVYGTSFNIYSDQSEQVRVSVVTGIVEFYAAKRNDKVRLVAGEKGTYNPKLECVSKEESNDRNFLAWKTGILYFNDTPLPEAFSLLQKQYSRVFIFEEKHNKLFALTTMMDNLPLEAVLDELNLLLNAKNESRNDTIFFESKN